MVSPARATTTARPTPTYVRGGQSTTRILMHSFTYRQGPVTASWVGDSPRNEKIRAASFLTDGPLTSGARVLDVRTRPAIEADRFRSLLVWQQ